jgi:hypothetical protein
MTRIRHEIRREPVLNIRRPTLNQFIELRLGLSSSPGNLLRQMFSRSFGAGSFDRFWRYWNPVYGYALYYWCYRPLRRYLPRDACVALTFAASGFLLHDLPTGWWIRLIRSFQAGGFPIPFVALWFSLMGVLTILSRALRLDYSRWPFAARAAVNGGCILGALTAALAITRLAS